MMIGQTISHYKILEKLGEGGMGIVSKAEDTKLERLVALKFLPPEFIRDTQAKERFFIEARAAAALEHQHICNIYEIDESEDRIFIVMSCFEGQTLKEKIDAGPLKIDETLKIAVQAAEGLQAAHEKGIVHRDIKSANIMFTEKEQTKIMDFGLAKLKGQTKITKQGSTLGTAPYMSPEQAQGVDVDHRTDIWSLGVVLYEMITGQLPFKGEYEQAVDFKAFKKSIDSEAKLSLPPSPSPVTKSKRKKIVVIPFENLGPPEDKYFADGMTEEITSRLAAVSGLGVISRTSAVQYDRKGKTMTQIGKDLGVDYVLEGTVRWDRGSGGKSRVRVTPQLISVSDDTHEIDPGFTLAYVELSKIHSVIYHQGYDPTKERITKAKAALDRALQLQPEMPEVHMALGYYHYWCHKAYEPALEEFSIARKGLPNETDILHPVALIQRRQGRFQEAINNLKSAIDLSPQNAQLAFELGTTNLHLRQYSQAELEMDHSISLAPDQVYAYLFKAMNYWCWKGDLEKARATLERVPQKNEAHSIFCWYLQEIFERNYQAALARLSSLSIDIINFFTFFIPKSQIIGYIYQYMKKPELAHTSFDSARILLEKEMKKQPDDPRIHSSLGIVYAALDRKEAAIRDGKCAVELYPVSKDSLFGPQRVEDLAHIYVLLGEYDIAIKKLEYLLSIPSFISAPWLRLDPKWDPLRQHPKFQKLLEKYSQDR